MPSVHLRRGLSPHYYAAFTDSQGRRRFRCTKTNDKATALAVAERLQREADLLSGRKGPSTLPLHAAPELLEKFVSLTQRAQEGTLTSDDARAALNSMLEAVGQSRLVAKSAREVFDTYLEETKKNRKAPTFARYSAWRDRFLVSLGKRADRPAREVTPDDVRRYRDAEKASLAATTAQQALIFVSAVFDLAVADGVIERNPAASLLARTDVAEGHERRDLTDAEVDSLLVVASPDWKTAILFARHLGLRLSDVANLRWEQIDLAAATLTFSPKKQRSDRPKKTKALPLPDVLRDHLSARPGVGLAPVMPSLYGRPTHKKLGLSNEFIALLDTANVKRKAVGQGARRIYDVSFHSLRHSAATAFARSGVAEDVRAEVLGHSIRVSKGYTHRTADDLRAAIAKPATSST